MTFGKFIRAVRKGYRVGNQKRFAIDLLEASTHTENESHLDEESVGKWISESTRLGYQGWFQEKTFDDNAFIAFLLSRTQTTWRSVQDAFRSDNEHDIVKCDTSDETEFWQSVLRQFKVIVGIPLTIHIKKEAEYSQLPEKKDQLHEGDLSEKVGIIQKTVEQTQIDISSQHLDIKQSIEQMIQDAEQRIQQSLERQQQQLQQLLAEDEHDIKQIRGIRQGISHQPFSTPFMQVNVIAGVKSLGTTASPFVKEVLGKPGEQFMVQMYIRNTGNTKINDLSVMAKLPNGLSLVKGTSYIYNRTNPDGLLINDVSDFRNIGGYNVYDGERGSVTVRYVIQVNEAASFKEGTRNILNILNHAVAHGEQSNYSEWFYVAVNVDAPSNAKENPAG